MPAKNGEASPNVRQPWQKLACASILDVLGHLGYEPVFTAATPPQALPAMGHKSMLAR